MLEIAKEISTQFNADETATQILLENGIDSELIRRVYKTYSPDDGDGLLFPIIDIDTPRTDQRKSSKDLADYYRARDTEARLFERKDELIKAGIKLTPARFTYSLEHRNYHCTPMRNSNNLHKTPTTAPEPTV